MNVFKNSMDIDIVNYEELLKEIREKLENNIIKKLDELEKANKECRLL